MRKIKLLIGNWCARIIRFLARKAKIELIGLAYYENGIMKSHSMVASGEVYFINKFLKDKLQTNEPTFVDIGANVGDYANLLYTNFPESKIHCFEPNPNTFAKLKSTLPESIKINNEGIGEKEGSLKLYFDGDNKTSVQATSDRKILEVISKVENIEEISIKIDTLDNYCSKENIESIDLLKIDTEGFEYEALQGAKSMLENKKIKMIQFEFNEINIVKRRFIRDFYELLNDFDFYRLDESRMIPLGEWIPKHEIFMFQNILAVAR